MKQYREALTRAKARERNARNPNQLPAGFKPAPPRAAQDYVLHQRSTGSANDAVKERAAKMLASLDAAKKL
jgi:hypothetical protein